MEIECDGDKTSLIFSMRGPIPIQQGKGTMRITESAIFCFFFLFRRSWFFIINLVQLVERCLSLGSGLPTARDSHGNQI